MQQTTSSVGFAKLGIAALASNIVLCYKIVFGLVSVNLDDFFEIRSVLGTRGHPFKLFLNDGVLVIFAVMFAERVINIWNSLPSIVNFSTLPSFRRTIHNKFSRFMKCR